LTDAELLKLFQSKFAPLQAAVFETVSTHIDADSQSYYEDVYETAAIVPQEDTVAALIAIWERHGMQNLSALAPELRKMAKDLRVQDATDQRVSDFIYAMY